MNGTHKRVKSHYELRADYRCYKQQTEARGDEPISFADYEDGYVDHVLDALDDEPEDTFERSRK